MFKVMDKYRLPAQILLGAIAVSFVGFGLAGYQMSHNNHYIVKVGDQIITRAQLDEAIRNTEAAGEVADRNQVFETLVSQAYLLEGAKLMGMTVSDEQIKEMVVHSPEFQDENKQFDQNLFRQYLEQHRLTEQQFMEEQRNRLLSINLISLLNSNVAADAQAQQVLNAAMAARFLRSVGLNPAAFVEKVKISDAALAKFYQANQKNYVLPQAVKFEYVLLSPKNLVDKQKVSDDELKKALAESKSAQEKRTISHILINAPDAASKEKAKAEAEKIAKEAKNNPKQFAELAKKYSQDEGTAQNGGTLGEFERHGMGEQAKAVEEAAFALKKGEVSDVVVSDFGYHIVYVSDIKGGSDEESKKAAAETQVKEKKAQQEYAKLREELSQLVFDHAKDLKHAAEKLGLDIKTQEEWLTHKNANELKVAPKVVEALFSDEVFNKKNNSEVISVDGETWVVRAVETRAETTQTLDKVKEAVKQDFVSSESLRLAKEEGKKLLALLQAGKVSDLKWSPTQEVTPIDLRMNLTPEAYQSVMKAIPKKGKSAYVLIDRAGVPEIVQVEKIATTNADAKTLASVKPMLMQGKGEALITAYIDSLRSQIPTQHGAERVSDSE